MSNAYPLRPWDQMHRHILNTWRPGEHVMVNGPTGVGKSTLISRLMPAQEYVVVFVTKVHDDTLTGDFKGFKRIQHWPPRKKDNKILLWPKPAKELRETAKVQRETFRHAMDHIFLDQNWCTVFDEQQIICKDLGLEIENKMFQQQGRSSGLSVVNGNQRPTFIPLVTLSGSTHYFLWQNTLKADLARLSDIGGIDKQALEREMLTLSKYEFLYINSRSGVTARSQVHL
jgi:hypothetical protein